MAIYLDNAATTPLHPEVVKAMTAVLQTNFGNPSSIHQYGRTAHHLLTNARMTIAESIHAKEQEIFFTSGGTESDNWALIQTAFSRRNLGKHLITTQVEHPAILETMAYLENHGFEVTYLPVTEDGQLAIETVEKALRPDTILVSLMYGNNETGVKFPIAEVGALLADHQAYFHTDAVQAYGVEELDVNALNVDLLSTSAHKIYGPKGVGFLYIREGLKLPSFLHGGEQEAKRRAGTENIPGIWGFAKAIEQLPADIKMENQQKYQAFADKIEEILKTEQITYQINGAKTDRLPHVLNIWFKDVPNDLLLMRLDLEGIAVSTGSACTAGNVQPSHVLESMYGKESKALKESLRISFGMFNTMEEVETFARKAVKIIHQLKK